MSPRHARLRSRRGRHSWAVPTTALRLPAALAGVAAQARLACLATVFAASATAAGSAAARDPPAHETIRVLYVGNSYTFSNDMPAMVSAMSRASPGAVRIEAGSVVQPGATLEDHWLAGNVQKAIRERKWDVVVLQEHSTRPMDDPQRLLHFGRLLGREIRAAGARTLLFLTWPRQSRPESMGALEAGYRALARELNAPLVPVGPAWLAAMRRSPSIALYQEDGSHPTRLGSYLTACVFYLALQRGQPPCPDVPDTPLAAEEARVSGLAATEALDAESKLARVRATGGPPAR